MSALQTAVSRIEASDPEARRGDGDGIHRLRTSIRRLRSELPRSRIMWIDHGVSEPRGS